MRTIRRLWLAFALSFLLLATAIHATTVIRPEPFLSGEAATSQHDLAVRFVPGSDEFWLMRWNPAAETRILRFVNRDGYWREAGPAPIPFDGNIAYPCFSPDGRLLFFDGWREGQAPDIWRTERQGDAWGLPERLGPQINGPDVEMLCSIASNGNIYFSSNRPDGLGSFDLYCSYKTAAGYARAENLGPAVNTVEFESHPFIAPDESFLLFDSRRSAGHGGNDIYISFRQPDGRWSQAQILPEAIDGPSGDMRPYVSPDGRTLYFCTDRRGKQEIFSVDAGFLDELHPRLTGDSGKR